MISHLILGHTPLASLRTLHQRAWGHVQPLYDSSSMSINCTLCELAANQGLDLNKFLFDLNKLEGALPWFLPGLPLTERIRLTKPTAPDPVADNHFDALWDATPMEKRRILDANPSLRQEIDPINLIWEALNSLPPEGVLMLIAPFEPLPLYVVLNRSGFQYLSTFRGDNWRIAIRQQEKENQVATSQVSETLDVRDLSPPEPMVKILEATATLQPGQSIHVLHSRIPHLLYSRLSQRNLQVVTEEAADGSIHLHITKV